MLLTLTKYRDTHLIRVYMSMYGYYVRSYILVMYAVSIPYT